MKWTLESSSAITELSVLAGGKATNLGRLSQKGFTVPEWFAVTSEALQAFVQENDLAEVLKPTADLGELSRRVEAAFLKGNISDSLKAEIFGKLKALGLEDSFVAVRSSGLDEDSAQNSFAGQFSSYLFQKGWEQIAESLKRCWASGFSERALSYRLERGLGLQDIRVGVVIQRMVNAEAAGVVFSRHPIKVLNRDEVLVSSVWGLGEGLVSGELESDDFEISRRTGKIEKRVVTKSHAMRQASEGGVVKEALTVEQGLQSSLSDEQVSSIAKLSEKLEESLGTPQDAEWVLDSGKLYLVQTRPVTSLPPSGFYSESINGTAPTLWDNSNIIESYSGVTSPLTFSFASRAYYQVYVQFCELMGVPQELVDARAKMFRNMLGLIRGRIYYNLVNWYQLVLMLPGSSSNKGFMDTMMGVKAQIKPEMAGIFDFVKEAPKYSLRARLRLLSQTIYRFRNIDKIIGEFNAHFVDVYEGTRKLDYSTWSLPRLVDHYHYLDEQLLKQWKAPIINDYLCMLFFGLLKKLTEKWVEGKGAADSLQNDLLCGEGGLESTEPTKFLMRMAARVDKGDPGFRSWMLSMSSDAVWKELQGSKKDAAFTKDLFEFLDKYGFRCVDELKLEASDLHDDPTFVINSIASYVRTGSYEFGNMEEREQGIRRGAEAKVRAKLSGFRWSLYSWVLTQARRAVKNRENLRFARTKVFGVCRHLFRAMGKKLAAMDLLDGERDIFFLTVEEIVGFVEGRGISGDIKSLVRIRKKEYLIYEDTPAPPDRLLTFGAAGASMGYTAILAEGDLLRTTEVNSDPNVLTGTPCCPGVVEGVVLVVSNLKDAEGLNGEILVTGRTDPGWVPLYPSCSGLLIERGSLLSHSAVVARELGLPTIVGVTGGLMTRLKTGDRVRVDAGKGEIRILEK